MKGMREAHTAGKGVSNFTHPPFGMEAEISGPFSGVREISNRVNQGKFLL